MSWDAILMVPGFDDNNSALRPLFTTHPQSITVNEGSPAVFTAALDGMETIEWQINDGGGWDTQVDTGGTFTIAFATESMDGYQVRAFATNGYGTRYSNAATLTVIPAEIFNNIFSDPFDTGSEAEAFDPLFEIEDVS